MPDYLDLSTWNRREHFEFFRHFDEPMFGLVSPVDVTSSYHWCKAREISFFLFYHYAALRAVNQIEAFRYRIQGQQVLIHSQIHLSTVVLRPDHSFGFSFIPFSPRFSDFSATAKAEIERVMQLSGLGLGPETARTDVIHCSTLPWMPISGLTHARKFGTDDSVPKITFGKLVHQTDGYQLSVALNAHHSLMDGYHAGLFYQQLQQLLNEPERLSQD